jgi:hypothetical protein
LRFHLGRHDPRNATPIALAQGLQDNDVERLADGFGSEKPKIRSAPVFQKPIRPSASA